MIEDINKVLWTVKNKANSKNINIYFIKLNEFNFEMEADWSNYQLILFNLI